MKAFNALLLTLGLTLMLPSLAQADVCTGKAQKTCATLKACAWNKQANTCKAKLAHKPGAAAVKKAATAKKPAAPAKKAAAPAVAPPPAPVEENTTVEEPTEEAETDEGSGDEY